MPLAFLAASLLMSGALTAAELNGLDSLCVTKADETVFVLGTSLSSATLTLAFLFRTTTTLRPVLWVGGLLCLGFILYFPLTTISCLAFLAYLAVPLSLYLPLPKGFLASLAAMAATCAVRFIVFPPEVLGQRSASFRDVLLFVCAPLAASALISLVAAFRAEMDRLGESLLGVMKLNLSYQDYSASVEEKSALEERLRLTRDIHDVVGYALTNTIMTMRAASMMCRKEPEKVPELLDSARADADQALSQVRAILGDLRRREIRSATGPNAIAKAVRAFRTATGAEVDLDFGNFDWSVFGYAENGNDAAFAASHFVKEGMLNAFSHGKATAIRVSFRSTEEGLVVAVKDNGGGAKEVEEGIGISGMRERIERLGGSLEYGSSNGGFFIVMRLPLPREGRSAGQPEGRA